MKPRNVLAMSKRARPQTNCNAKREKKSHLKSANSSLDAFYKHITPQNNEQRETVKVLSEDYAEAALCFRKDTSTTLRTVRCAPCGTLAEQDAKVYDVHDKLPSPLRSQRKAHANTSHPTVIPTSTCNTMTELKLYLQLRAMRKQHYSKQ